MEKVKTMQEAYRVFELLGIKEVTKPFQKRKGTEVWELPFKTYYGNGHSEINRFSVYKNGYIRKMIVWGENNASKGCYQLNRVCKVASFVKDYKWSDLHNCSEWTGKYRKVYNNERIMIDTHKDRIVYLCNYILKNYYRNNKVSLVGEYTVKRINQQQTELRNSKGHDLPFRDEDDKFFSSTDDVQVIINGHRYNLS